MSNSQTSRIEEIESWWALIARILAFILGVVLLLIEATSDTQRLYLIVAGIGCIGPVVAQSVATVFAGIRGVEPPKPPAPEAE